MTRYSFWCQLTIKNNSKLLSEKGPVSAVAGLNGYLVRQSRSVPRDPREEVLLVSRALTRQQHKTDYFMDSWPISFQVILLKRQLEHKIWFSITPNLNQMIQSVLSPTPCPCLRESLKILTTWPRWKFNPVTPKHHLSWSLRRVVQIGKPSGSWLQQVRRLDPVRACLV